MSDLIIPAAHSGKFRKDWGLQNVIGFNASRPAGGDLMAQQSSNALAQQRVRHKIATFVQRAVYPQQLSVPRQYATTTVGTFIYKILEGRTVDGFQEQGARVIVQENLKQARFVISPLFESKHDAIDWARQQMGAEV